jgi:hypothetical protein
MALCDTQCRAQLKSIVCMLVHCWVSGALSPFLVPDHFAGVHGLCVLVDGWGVV